MQPDGFYFMERKIRKKIWRLSVQQTAGDVPSFSSLSPFGLIYLTRVSLRALTGLLAWPAIALLNPNMMFPVSRLLFCSSFICSLVQCLDHA